MERFEAGRCRSLEGTDRSPAARQILPIVPIPPIINFVSQSCGRCGATACGPGSEAGDSVCASSYCVFIVNISSPMNRDLRRFAFWLVDHRHLISGLGALFRGASDAVMRWTCRGSAFSWHRRSARSFAGRRVLVRDLRTVAPCRPRAVVAWWAAVWKTPLIERHGRSVGSVAWSECPFAYKPVSRAAHVVFVVDPGAGWKPAGRRCFGRPRPTGTGIGAGAAPRLRRRGGSFQESVRLQQHQGVL